MLLKYIDTATFVSLSMILFMASWGHLLLHLLCLLHQWDASLSFSFFSLFSFFSWFSFVRLYLRSFSGNFELHHHPSIHYHCSQWFMISQWSTFGNLGFITAVPLLQCKMKTCLKFQNFKLCIQKNGTSAGSFIVNEVGQKQNGIWKRTSHTGRVFLEAGH